MTKYMLILRADATVDYGEFSPADLQKLLEAYQAWSEKLAKQGRLHDGKKLTDQGGKVMIPRGKSSPVTIKDGPFQETKEVVGGFYVISADSYDHAVELCRDHPNLQFGSIEIREIDFMGQPED
jgi:hypothetical protein